MPTIAYRLADPATGDRRFSSRFAYVASLVRSAIFGGQDIAQAFLEDLFIIPLRPKLKTLDFGAKWAKACDAYSTGRVDAVRGLKRHLEVDPERVADYLRRDALLLKSCVNEERREQSLPEIRQVRACLIVPDGPHSLRIAFSWNMSGDADDRLGLDRRARGAPAAYRRRRIKYWTATGPQPYQTKYERALTRSTLRSALCIPVFPEASQWKIPPEKRLTPVGVLRIDSDDELRVSIARLSWLARASMRYAALSMRGE